LKLWPKDHPQARVVRNLAYKSDKSYQSYRSYVEESPPEIAANTLLCLIHQANYLLDRQLRHLEQRFLAEGGFTERLYSARRERRATPAHRSDESHRSNESYRSDGPQDAGCR
jgi:restriction system protein